MYMNVSSETGVNRGLAALRAKLQRHFLGAAANRGNRRGKLRYLETAARSFVV